jgi:DNA (cytosine-5)-methyltransferase 1
VPGEGKFQNSAVRESVHTVTTDQPTAIDLFCGAGGLTHGLRDAGLRVVLGVDVDPDARFPYESNNPGSSFLQRDLWYLRPEEIASYYPEGSTRILAGCAPCEPFSSYTQGTEVSARKDWALLDRYAEFASTLDPTVLTMENVANLRNHDVYRRFHEKLVGLGYHVTDHDVDCSRYGVPQRRTRLVLLASKLGPIELVRTTHATKRMRTVRHAIGELSRLRAGAVSRRDPLHRAAGLREQNLNRIRASKPGGSWLDWDEELRAPCHRTEGGRTYTPVYGRMSWDRPAPTITARCFNYGSGRFGHPSANRAISLREAALLQSFPKGYRFVETGSEIRFRTVGRLIGNAVPVRLGRVIGRSILRHLADYDVGQDCR